MVARLGVEPRLTGPEPVVLPLHHRAKIAGMVCMQTIRRFFNLFSGSEDYLEFAAVVGNRFAVASAGPPVVIEDDLHEQVRGRAADQGINLLPGRYADPWADPDAGMLAVFA